MNFSNAISNAIIKSYPIGLDNNIKQPPNVVFSLSNPYILEAIPDKYINQKKFDELFKLEGRKLDEVLKILESWEDKSDAVVSNPIQSNNFKTNLYEKLAQYYDKNASSRIKAGAISSAKIFSDLAQAVRNRQINEDDLYSKLYTELYNNIRLFDYPITKDWNPFISEVTGKGNQYMMVQESDRWHYRIPKRRHDFGWSRDNKAVDRISVNANTDKELIAKLDEYFGSGKAKGYYKTPSDSAGWLERHDPITIYLIEKANSKILRDIENITKPYIRSKQDVLVGKKFASGLALEKSPSSADIEKLLTRISDKNSLAAQVIRKELIGNLIRKGLPKDSPLIASAGEITALEQFLKLL